MSVAVARFIERLKERGCDPKCNGQSWQARCPAHDDDRPSLSVKAGDDGKVLFRCHAGCGFADVLEALKLEPRDLFPGNGKARGKAVVPARRIVAEYDYTDERGGLLFQVVRLEPKTFRMGRPDDAGRWIWSVGGVPRVLYRLPEFLAADPGSTVYLIEGEKDVDRLRSHGLVATCNSGGGEKWKFVDDSPLHGRNVVVIPDNDGPGINHAQQVAAALHDKAASVKVLAPLAEMEHGDVSDFLDDGGDPEDLDRLAAEAPEWEPGPPPVPRALSRDEAQRKLRGIFKLGRTIVRAGIDLCCELADFYEGGGLEALDDGDGPLPMSYIASGLGVTKQRVHQLIEAGRSWRRCVNQVDADMAEDVTERLLRPLAKLEPDLQPGAIKAACRIASEDHETEQAQREAAGRKHTRLRLRPKHVRQAVAALLPENPLAAQPDPLQALRKKILGLMDLARSIGAPPGVAVGLMAANTAATRGAS